MINDEDYANFVESKAAPQDSVGMRLIVSGLGMGEAGELAGEIKKIAIHGHPLNLDKLIKEMGDVEFYMTYLRTTLGISRQVVLEANVKKLNERYPEGFSSDKSINRKEEHSDT